MSRGSILEPIVSRYGSALVHTKVVFNLWQHKVVKHLEIGLVIDVPVKKVWPNGVVPHWPDPHNKLVSRRGFVVHKVFRWITTVCIMDDVVVRTIPVYLKYSLISLYYLRHKCLRLSQQPLAVLDSFFWISFTQMMTYLHICMDATLCLS